MDKQPTTEKETPPAFDGFVQPKKNYFPMPNAWIDICAGIDNLAELKIVQYVLRHTWGYQEYGITKTITIDEFMCGRKRADGSRMDKGTGLSKQGVVDGVKRAMKHEYLVCDVDETDKARVKKSYALKMRPCEEEADVNNGDSDVNDVDTSGCQEIRQQMSKTLTSAVKEVDSGGLNSRQRSEKYTSRNTPKKDTEEKQGTYPAPLSPSQPSDADASTRAQSEQEDFHIIGEFIAERGGYHHPSKPWLKWDSLNAPSVICADLTGDPSEDVSRKAEAIRLRDHLSLRYQDIELIFESPQGQYHDLAGNIVDPLAEAPYRPDFSANQPQSASIVREVDAQALNHAQPTSQESVQSASQANVPIVDVPRTAEISANARQAELSTSTVEKPRNSAKVETRARTRPARGKKPTEYKIYFSTEGYMFRTWYEELTGAPVDETAANARACNALGKRASVTRDNLRLVLARIDGNKWVNDNNVVVTLQDLASDDGKLRWEKWLQPTRPKKIPTREEDPYSVAALLEEQNPGYFAEKEALETAWRN